MANMLTTKELSLISDLLVMEETAFKKAKLYSRTLTDPEISKKLKEIADGHKKRFDALFSLL